MSINIVPAVNLGDHINRLKQKLERNAHVIDGALLNILQIIRPHCDCKQQATKYLCDCDLQNAKKQFNEDHVLSTLPTFFKECFSMIDISTAIMVEISQDLSSLSVHAHVKDREIRQLEDRVKRLEILEDRVKHLEQMPISTTDIF